MWHTDNNKTRKTVWTAVGMVAAVAVGFVGCSKEGSHPCPPEADHYVNAYVKPADVFAAVVEKAADGLNEAGTHGNEDVVLKVSFWPVAGRKILSVEQPSKEQEKEYRSQHFISFSAKTKRVYDSLCIAHGDTEYFVKAGGRIGDEFSGTPVFRRMTLDVVSDTDYDSTHPAGTSLIDILSLKTRSVQEIIENGYDASLCKDRVINFGYPLEMPLAQFNSQYRKLVDGQFELTFAASPQITATHRFTVIYRDEDGRIITGVSNPVRLKGTRD